MIVRNISIKNFRGIKEASIPIGRKSRLICLIGQGDSGKSTILTAINFALFPYHSLNFYQSDFYKQETSCPIEIIATIGELPDSILKNDDGFGHYFRYCDNNGDITDEIEDPDDEDNYQKVISVKLVVDDTLEPKWTIFNERIPDQVPISGGGRNKFNVYLIDEYNESHFSWGRYSPLAKMSSESPVKNKLISQMVGKTQSGSLIPCDVCTKKPDGCDECEDNEWYALEKTIIKEFAKHGLDSTLNNLSPKADFRGSSPASSVSLCANNIPLRLNGKGTCRLSSIALQKANTNDDSIMLIDEIEHGLEPYRLRNLIRSLRGEAKGQIISTTHSSVVIEECKATKQELYVVRNVGGLLSASPFPADLENIQRKHSEAFLSRKIIIGEGKTEAGFIRGLDVCWQKLDSLPITCYAVSLAVGTGGDSFATEAEKVQTLGYSAFVVFDSDLSNPNKKNKVVYDRIKKTVSDNKISFIEWDGGCCFEQRLCQDVTGSAIAKLIKEATNFLGSDKIKAHIFQEVASADRINIEKDFDNPLNWGFSEVDLKKLVGNASSKNGWFKDIDRAEKIAIEVYADIIPDSILDKKIQELKKWIENE